MKYFRIFLFTLKFFRYLETMKHLIFVYGTLKTRQSRNNILSNSECLGIFKSLPKYTMVNLDSFPGIFEGGNTSISGEIYRVSEEVLHQLDLVEGHPDFYFRKKIFVYDNQDSSMQRILKDSDGIWIRKPKEKAKKKNDFCNILALNNSFTEEI